MTVKRDDAILIDDMIMAAEAITSHIQDMTADEFFRSKVVQDAVQYKLAVLGEAANAMSNTFVADHPDIPWRAITGMRHRVIHGYGSVDLDIVWDTATHNVVDIVREATQNRKIDEQLIPTWDAPCGTRAKPTMSTPAPSPSSSSCPRRSCRRLTKP